ncbi:hypothetical protein [Clostridium thermarum]|uniref:hypothetical protein n=1 Tax=Clostridium thermarum TaxID=1716543 RepID=UPI0015D6694E|nr:hypothetical protein [Clostridium thermarum]
MEALYEKVFFNGVECVKVFILYLGSSIFAGALMGIYLGIKYLGDSNEINAAIQRNTLQLTFSL